MADVWRGTRLHVVTGKGGTGKTTIAAALACALADRGQRVLVCDVEGRQTLARVFGTSSLDYSERTVAERALGGEVCALSVDPREALLDYLESFYLMGTQAGKLFDALGAVDFATTIAPGLKDVLLTGKVYEAAKPTRKPRRGARAKAPFDAVVVDAPPTGRVTRFLDVSAEVSDLAKVGPIHSQAESMRAMMHAPSTVVHMVSTLHAMPVQEALDGVEELREAGFRLGAMFINRTGFMPLDEDDRERLRQGAHEVLADELSRAGLSTDLAAFADTLASVGQRESARLGDQETLRDQLTSADMPQVDVPYLPGGISPDALSDVAAILSERGVGA